jgi:hypothetical protein
MVDCISTLIAFPQAEGEILSPVLGQRSIGTEANARVLAQTQGAKPAAGEQPSSLTIDPLKSTLPFVCT